jgi:PAS domain S-box-containing protein
MLTDSHELGRLVDNLDVAVFSVSADLQSVLYINRAMETLFGRSAADFRVRPTLWLEAIDPVDRPIVGDPAAEALASGSARHLYRILRPDGPCRWVLDQTRRIDDAQGRPERLDCAFTDITRRMEIERALRDDASLLRQLADCAPVGIILQDGLGVITYANHQACQLLGDIVGRSQEERLALIHPEDRVRMADVLVTPPPPQQARRGEFRVIRPDGEVRWVLAIRMELREDDSTVLGFVEAVHDITDAYQAELALRKSEYEYRSVIENIQDAFYRADADGRLLITSPSGSTMFGYASPAELVGVSITSLWCNVEERERAVTLMATRGGVRDFEAKLRRRDGSCFDAAITAQACFAEDGTRIGTEGIVRDISARKRAQEALRALPQRIMRAQEEERRAIACELHDTVIQGVVALKLRCDEGLRGGGASSRSSPWDQVPSALDEIIQQLRGIATSLRPPSLDLLGLPAAVRSWVSRVVEDACVDVMVEVDCGALRLGPQQEIHCFRIVQEAVTNALRHARPMRLIVRLGQTEGGIEIYVADDGRGFVVEEARRRALQSGHLGLSVMEERVAALSGTLEVTSAPGEGTTVSVRVPLERQDARPSDEPGA